MAKTKRRKWLWLLLIPAALLIFMQLRFKFATMIVTQLRVQTKSCAEPLFTSPPVAFEDLESITPLGNLNPPDHTLPTDHVYIGLPSQTNRLDPNLPPPAVRVAAVYAPADVIVTDIERVQYLDANGAVQRADFTVAFAPCRSVSGYYGHLSALSAELEKLTQGRGDCSQYNIQSAGASAARSCRFAVGQSVKVGTQIGQAGEQFSSFDLGLSDSRSARLAFVNSRRYFSDYLQTVCPFDYYSDETKKKFAAYYGLIEKKRTIPPVCGEIMQDKAGTAQGNWFFGDAREGPEGWSKELSLVHDNIDPSMGVISVGGTVSQPQRLQFLPAHSGTNNREFGEIKPGPEIYCYPSLADGYGTKRGQQLVIQLVDADTLKIEQQSGTCASHGAFTGAAKTYNR